MSNKKYFFGIFLLVVASCTKFEDAGVTERKTFVHFYGSATNYFASVAELDTDGGFILSGEVRYDNGVTDALVIKTDSRGHKIWERVIPKGVVNAVRPTGSGYILAGDSIQQNPTSADVNELENTYAKLMLMDAQGNILARHISTDSIIVTQSSENVTLTVDYHADALALDHNGNVIMLGSFRTPGEKQAAFVSAFNPSNLGDSLWYRSYVSLDDDLINSRALHVTPSSTLVWAGNTYRQEQNLTREYLSIYKVAPNSNAAPEIYGVFGQDDDRNHSVKDIQKAAVGFGAIGTYSETNGLNANIYFIRIEPNLEVRPENVRYIDGEELLLNNTLLGSDSRTTSTSFDEGLAIAATADGFVLAGALTTTPTVGNGGKDILLVKLDPFGNLLWKKLLGGTGDEVVVSVRETADKGLLLFGTNTINGLSTLMLIKTDERGEIKD